jgi:hypothetical protein
MEGAAVTLHDTDPLTYRVTLTIVCIVCAFAVIGAVFSMFWLCNSIIPVSAWMP